LVTRTWATNVSVGSPPSISRGAGTWTTALRKPEPAGDDHPELRRDDVELLGNVFADPVQRAATARTGLVVGLDHAVFARQMLWQRAATLDSSGASSMSMLG
jgi:hypothetical protein